MRVHLEAGWLAKLKVFAKDKKKRHVMISVDGMGDDNLKERTKQKRCDLQEFEKKIPIKDMNTEEGRKEEKS